MRFFILNKPRGCITGRRDPHERPTVYDHVPPHYPPLPHVGRLDFHTEGLLLFTDDGRLARAMLDRRLHGRAVTKRYEVKVRPRLDRDPHAERRLARMREPLVGDDESLPAEVRLLRHRTRASWIEVVLREGRHHQVRRLCRRAGFQIVKLRRVAFGPLALGDLRPRWCRPLSRDEVAACYALALPGEPLPEIEPLCD